MNTKTMNIISSTNQASPAMELPRNITWKLNGLMGQRVDALISQYILPMPLANPAILEMFRERESVPYRRMEPWAGEFAGKYLTFSVLIWRLTGSEELRKHLAWFVSELVALQDSDGYLGPWPKSNCLTQQAPNGIALWDVWGHYHAMIGLLFWYESSGDYAALNCAKRIGDICCDRFLTENGSTLHKIGAHEQNQAVSHSLAKLYRLTGEKRYLDMALAIVDEFTVDEAGDYFRLGLANVPFHQLPRQRWESLHPIMVLVELYYITGKQDYRTAFENLWWSMLEGDRHNNGGFTSDEKATGDPLHAGPIESCCTVAWSVMTMEMLLLTGDSRVADELELSLLNSGLGMLSPSGRWVTYNTPMEGIKQASAHTIVFQSRAGSPELNCCSVNGPRIIGQIAQWGLLHKNSGFAVNYYGPCSAQIQLPSGLSVSLTQKTNYPAEPEIRLEVGLDSPATFPIYLRIPAWSHDTIVRVNNQPINNIRAGEYLKLSRHWKPGDVIALSLDFRLHYWLAGKYQPYRDWNLDWRVFGTISTTKYPNKFHAPISPVLENITAATEQVTFWDKTFQRIACPSKQGMLDLSFLSPGNKQDRRFVCVAEFESDMEGQRELLLSTGSVARIVVNQKIVLDRIALWREFNKEITNQYLGAQQIYLQLPIVKGTNTLAIELFTWPGLTPHISISRKMTLQEVAADPSLKDIYQASIYRGPILLAFDPRYNSQQSTLLRPVLQAHAPLRAAEEKTWLKPWMLFETNSSEKDASVFLCDFASAGLSGKQYVTWLPLYMPDVKTAEFSKTNLMRSVR